MEVINIEEQKVEIKIVSIRGHDTLVLAMDEAIDEIFRQTNYHSKWLMVDGSYVEVNSVTEDSRSRLRQTLREARTDVTLTDALLGG